MYNGIINIHKEKGFTSHDVVAKLRGILKQKKIGHTGTLDPDATGVLPVCLGKGTKLCEILLDKNKTYEAVMLFGILTDTEDVSGKVVKSEEVSDIRKRISDEEIENVIKGFIGEYMQVPPMYSAIKVNGKKLYELAREGKEIERQKRLVEIKDISINYIDFPRVSFTVTCSKGTYIRSLCRDIGEKLGTVACMEELARTKVNQFTLDNAYTLSMVEQFVKEGVIDNYIMTIDDALNAYQKVKAKPECTKLLHNGNAIKVSMLAQAGKLNDNEKVRLYDCNDEFIGIYEYTKGIMKLYKMFYENN